MLAIAESKDIQKLARSRHIAGLISVCDGYINANEHAQVGANLRERLAKKAKAGDKVWFALISRGHKYIFYFVGKEDRIVRKLQKVKEDA